MNEFTRIQKIIGICLFLVVAISKHLIILNEEILVAFSFLAFLFFCSKKFADTVNKTFEARTITTHIELENYLKTQIEATENLCISHKKFLNTRGALEDVFQILSNQLEKLPLIVPCKINTILTKRIKERLDTLSLQQTQFDIFLQEAIINNFRLSIKKISSKKI